MKTRNIYFTEFSKISCEPNVFFSAFQQVGRPSLNRPSPSTSANRSSWKTSDTIHPRTRCIIRLMHHRTFTISPAIKPWAQLRRRPPDSFRSATVSLSSPPRLPPVRWSTVCLTSHPSSTVTWNTWSLRAERTLSTEHRITITFLRPYVHLTTILSETGRDDYDFNNYFIVAIRQVQEQSPSSQTMDSSNDTSVKVVNNSFSQPGAGNAIPGYPPQQPPQSQQSSHSSNG